MKSRMANRSFQQMAYQAFEQRDTLVKSNRSVSHSNFPVSMFEMDRIRNEPRPTAASVLNLDRTHICGIALVIR